MLGPCRGGNPVNAVSGPSPARGCPYGLSGILGAALHRYILCIPGARRLPPDGSAAFTVILCGFKTRLLHRCIVFPERGPKPVLLPESAAPSVAFTERRSSGFFCPLSIFSYQYTGGYGQMQGVFPDIKNSIVIQLNPQMVGYYFLIHGNQPKRAVLGPGVFQVDESRFPLMQKITACVPAGGNAGCAAIF